MLYHELINKLIILLANIQHPAAQVGHLGKVSEAAEVKKETVNIFIKYEVQMYKVTDYTLKKCIHKSWIVLN